MRSDIIFRMREVIRAVTSDKRRLKELEEETGIPSKNWKNAWLGTQRPTAHMIEALARRWPQYAFWLSTGLTDPKNGHTAPPNSWTCGEETASKNDEISAINYFELKILYQDFTYGMSKAIDSNYIPDSKMNNQGLSAEQLNEQLEIEKMLYGKSANTNEPAEVLKKKHSDLDIAIADIAFRNRIASLKEKYFSKENIRGEDRWKKFFEERSLDLAFRDLYLELEKKRGTKCES